MAASRTRPTARRYATVRNWILVSGRWSLVSGLRSLISGLRYLVSGLCYHSVGVSMPECAMYLHSIVDCIVLNTKQQVCVLPYHICLRIGSCVFACVSFLVRCVRATPGCSAPTRARGGAFSRRAPRTLTFRRPCACLALVPYLHDPVIKLIHHYMCIIVSFHSSNSTELVLNLGVPSYFPSPK
jgi:hypothetical protein